MEAGELSMMFFAGCIYQSILQGFVLPEILNQITKLKNHIKKGNNYEKQSR